MPDNAPDLLFYADAAGGLISETGWVTPEAVFAPHAETPHALWLDSSHDAHAASRASYIATRPYQIISGGPEHARQHFDAADAAFHAQVASAAGNDVLSGFVSHLWRMRESEMWALWYNQTRKVANRHRSIEDHRVILRAIERRLPDAARTAMQAHLDVLADRFYELKL